MADRKKVIEGRDHRHYQPQCLSVKRGKHRHVSNNTLTLSRRPERREEEKEKETRGEIKE